MKEHFGKYLGPTLIDEAQPLTVWRTWRLGRRKDDVRPLLVSTWKQWEWTAGGDVTVAECLADKKKCHVAMMPGCDCGLWGAVALTNLMKHGAVALFPTGMLGRAHLWGFVHVYEFGFRASMGRPSAGWLGSSAGRAHADRIAAAYKIPVEIGLPVEVVVDPDLLSPKKVLKAASAYMAAQAIVARQQAAPAAALPDVAPRPNLMIPARHKRRYRCSGCGAQGFRVDRCPTCVKRPVKV